MKRVASGLGCALLACAAPSIVDGVLGADVSSRCTTVIDFAARSLELHSCGEATDP